MTREEAIEMLKSLVEVRRAYSDMQTMKDEIECLKIAIKALEQEPCREADDYENEISDLYNHLDIVEYDKERLREEVTTLEEKLKGLFAEPCGDAISRQAALDAMCALCNTGETLKENQWRDNPHIDAIIDALDNLQPVTPEPKTGHWVNKSRRSGCGVLFVESECTCCGKKTPFNCDEFLYRYCPNCGCRMVEPQESEGEK